MLFAAMWIDMEKYLAGWILLGEASEERNKMISLIHKIQESAVKQQQMAKDNNFLRIVWRIELTMFENEKRGGEVHTSEVVSEHCMHEILSVTVL